MSVSAMNEDFPEVPSKHVTMETCRYLGFSESGSRSLIETWHVLQREGFYNENTAVEFGNFVVEVLNTRADLFDPNSDWTKFLTEVYGLHDDVVHRIMFPEYDDIRVRHRPYYWVSELVLHKWHAFTSQTGSLSHQSSSGQTSEDNSSSSKKTQITSKDVGEPSTNTIVPGFTTLFRGVYGAQAAEMFPDGVSAPWELRMTASQSPSDFSPESSMHYWTPQYMLAYKYARYKRNIAAGSDQSTYVVQMKVPNAWIESQECLTLDFPSDLFKQVVWKSRRRARFDRDTASSAIGAQFFIGDVLTGSAAQAIDRRFWQDINPSDILYTSPYPAVNVPDCGVRQKGRQYAFSIDLGCDLEAIKPQPAAMVLHPEGKHEVPLQLSL